MRADELTPPAVSPGPRPGPATPLGRWPVDLFVAVQRSLDATYTWDDPLPEVVWDSPQTGPGQWDVAQFDEARWDDPAGGGVRWDYIGVDTGWQDVTCDLIGYDVTAGGPDQLGIFPAAQCDIELDNATGRWSQYDTTGRLVFYGPGQLVRIWTVDRTTGEACWQFTGRVADWIEDPQRRTVNIEAFDVSADLAAPILPRTFGVADQRAADRLAAIVADRTDAPTRFDRGDVTLDTIESREESSPLDEAHLVAMSDGGTFHAEPDGTLVYWERSWRRGRADQPRVWVVSDVVCTADVVLADVQIGNVDDALSTSVTVSNERGHAHTAHADALQWQLRGDRYPSTPPRPLLYQTAAQGVALADAYLSIRSNVTLRLVDGSAHLHDPRVDLWGFGVDVRIGDVVRFVTEVPAVDGFAVLDVDLSVERVERSVTGAGTFVVNIGTAPAFRTRTLQLWDDPALVWDSSDQPVWGY